MKNKLASYFHFTRAERNGALVLGTLCVLVFVLPDVIARFYNPPEQDFSAFAEQIRVFQADNTNDVPDHPAALFYFDPNTASAETFIKLGLGERIAASICKYRDKGGKFRRPEDFGKIYNLPPADYQRLLPYIRIASEENGNWRDYDREQTASAFPFDPNTATDAELQELGLSPRLVSNILKYREKGGRFRVKEDFGKLYGLSDADFQRLEPFLLLPEAQGGDYPRPVAYSAGASASFAVKKEVAPIDINRAAKEDWQRLPGIGAWRAGQIVGYRDLLGGFAAVEQVAETRGLPDSVFQQIKPYLSLITPVYRTISINTATIEELDAHPMISRKQAELIVRYRDQHGPYRQVEDIRKIAAFREGGWVEKILPYLRQD